MDPEAQSMLGRPGQPGNRQQRGHTGILYMARTLNFITACCLFLCGAAFAMAIYVRAGAIPKDLFYMSGQIVRCFGIFFSIVLILVETEWRWLLKLMPLLDSWVGRGVIQAFIASLCYREAYPKTAEMTDFHKSLQLYRTVASVALFCCASLYVLGGILCLGAIKRMQENRLAAETEYEELERRRRELNRILGRSE